MIADEHVSPHPLVSERVIDNAVAIFHDCRPGDELLTLGRWHKRYGFQRRSDMMKAQRWDAKKKWTRVDPMKKCPLCGTKFDWQPVLDYIHLEMEW